MSVGGDGAEGEPLQLSEILLAVCDALTDGVFLHRGGRILHVNRAGEQILGYGAGELVGVDVRQLASPRSRQDAAIRFAAAQTDPFEIWGLRRDGTDVRVELRAHDVRVGDMELRAAVVRDLSSEKASERERQASVALLRATLESTADGLLVIDSVGRIALYNEHFRRMWSIPEEILKSGDDERAIEHAVTQLGDPRAFRGRIDELEVRPELDSTDLLELRDGRVFERYSLPQRIGHEVVGRVISFRDVTAQHRAARASELAVQMRDEFLAIASHELFAPITSLSVAMHGLRGSTDVTPEQARRLWDNATRQVDRLARLVHELLDVTRIDGGRLELQRVRVDLVEVAAEAIERFSVELEQGGIVATLDAPAPVVGDWDRARLEQVISNLLGNAIKFGQGKPIEVTVRHGSNGAELGVRDHGIGVAEAQQALIFERFQRAVSSRHFAGLGLGLYIARRIVEAHGGSLGLVSAPGEGATFTVRLPG